jgi:diguanylate cyclase (GGDEF)-like protein
VSAFTAKKNQSLGTRVGWINQVTLLTAVTIIALVVITSSFFTGMVTLISSSMGTATVLAENTSAILLFEDVQTAEQLLSSLSNADNVEAVAIYRQDLQPFASFVTGAGEIPAVLPFFGESVAYGFMHIEVVEPIMHDGATLGMLYMLVSLKSLYLLLIAQLLLTLVAVLGALYVARRLSRRLSNAALEPLLQLTGLMETVSSEANLQLRASPSDIRELDTLARGFNGMLEQIQEREVQVLSAQNRLQATLDAIPDLMLELDSEGRYLNFHCPVYKAERRFPGMIVGNLLADGLPAEAAATCMAALWEAEEHGFSNGKQFMLERDGTALWYELSVARKADAADGQRFVVLARDITERKDAEARIHNLAYFDSLTRLPSRLSFLERLDREVRRAVTVNDKLGVLFLDLDGFKNINDTLGHTIGDLALQEVADRLRTGLRPSDMLSRGSLNEANVSLARLGGDEFTVLMLNLREPVDAMIVAERIRELLRRPFRLENHEVVMTASIGIAIFPDDGATGATLLKHADSAMYYAKDGGRDNYQFYRASMTRMAVERMSLDSHLRLALERDEFFLVYQPQYDPATGSIHSLEALIRWNHPQRGLVSPAEFIPRTEANGLIVPIGEWVLRTACSDLKTWLPYSSALRVAVNLSPLQFRNPVLLNTIQTILAETGLPPAHLELEVTEGGLMECSEANLQTLYSLRKIGITIALDDFGTGYSSMSYLKRLPLNHIKVDQSFVSGLPDSRDSLAIVKAIISLAKNLDFTVTAEGVETIEQALLLKDLHCDLLQGYYFGKPIAAAAIPELIKRRWAVETITSLPELVAM